MARKQTTRSVPARIVERGGLVERSEDVYLQKGVAGSYSKAEAWPARRDRVRGVVRPCCRRARGDHAGRVPQHQCDQPALPDDPSLRLVGSAHQSAAVRRPGHGAGECHEVMAATGGMVKLSAHLRSGRSAGAHGSRSSGLLGSVVGLRRSGSRRVWLRCSNGMRPEYAGG